MPVVTSDLLAALYTNYRSLWNDQFLAASQQDRLLNKIAMTVDSNTDTETYAWFGTVPKMREWIGERQLSSITPTNYSIRNKDWESTLEVDRNAIEDDKLGQIRPRISQMATEAMRSQEQLAVDVLEGGSAATIAGLAYDGQFFFDTDHATPGAEYQTSQSNKLTGTGVTLANIQTDYATAVAAMRSFKDDRGRPMNLTPTDVVVPPALEGVFRQFLTSESLPSGSVAAAANPWRNNVTLNVNGYLTDATDWYLLCLNEPVKPLVFQMRRAPEFNALDNPSQNEAAFMRKRYMYGVDGRWNIGYGMWQMAIRVTNS
jgi:phage major head subunit gpT-like protein